VVSKPVTSIWTFGLTAFELTLLRVVGMDTSRPLHFDGTNFSYYKARMACYLEAVDLGVWRLNCDGMKPIKNPNKPTKNEEKEIQSNARAKNCLFESFSMDVFNQVFTLNTAHEIWLKLQELIDGISNVREQKHCLAQQSYDSFEMNDDELVHDMYSRLNLIINELNSIGLTKLGDVDIVRKIISILYYHERNMQASLPSFTTWRT
jgi:hypothetical protein